MARKIKAPVQQFRGTTAQHSTYTGPVGELTVDVTKKTVVVQDGTTAGGTPLAREQHSTPVATAGIAGHVYPGTGLSVAGDGALSVAYGTTAGTAVQGNDARLSDVRPPAAHAASHNIGGSDALPAASTTTAGLVKIGTAAGTACAGDDTRLTNARPPLVHVSNHLIGGSDALPAASTATAGLIKIGTTAGTACAGDDPRIVAGLTPAKHVSTHLIGGSDAMPRASLTTPGLVQTGVDIQIVSRNDINIYQRDDGNDSNDGLSVNTPLRSIDGIYALVSRYDFSGKRLIINFLSAGSAVPGTGTHGLEISGALFGRLYGLRLRGVAGNSPVIMGKGSGYGLLINNPAHPIVIENLHFYGTGLIGMAVYGASVSIVGTVDAGVAANSGNSITAAFIEGESRLWVDSGATFRMYGAMVPNGSTGCLLMASRSSSAISAGGSTMYFQGDTQIGTIVSDQGSTVILDGTLQAGASNKGPRFHVTHNSQIITGGRGLTFIPGTSDGVVNSAAFGFYS